MKTQAYKYLYVPVHTNFRQKYPGIYQQLPSSSSSLSPYQHNALIPTLLYLYISVHNFTSSHGGVLPICPLVFDIFPKGCRYLSFTIPILKRLDPQIFLIASISVPVLPYSRNDVNFSPRQYHHPPNILPSLLHSNSPHSLNGLFVCIVKPSPNLLDHPDPFLFFSFDPSDFDIS